VETFAVPYQQLLDGRLVSGARQSHEFLGLGIGFVGRHSKCILSD
jgi:hypothetical protein